MKIIGEHLVVGSDDEILNLERRLRDWDFVEGNDISGSRGSCKEALYVEDREFHRSYIAFTQTDIEIEISYGDFIKLYPELGEPTKRIPKVGDKIRILKGGYRRYNAGDIITLDFANDMFMHNGDASKRYIEISKTDTREFYDEVEEPKVAPPKRVPKVGDYIKWLGYCPREDRIYKVIRSNPEGYGFITDDEQTASYDKEGLFREFRDGEVPERFREELLCEYIGELSGHQIYCDIPVPMFKAGDCDIGRTQDGSISICSTISDKPLSTIKKIMSKLEQFRANLYFSDKKMEKIGELADKLEGYASDIDDLVYNLEIVSGKLESYAEDIETAVDEDDRVAATQLIDEATEYLSKVSTLDALSSMLSNAKALDKFTDKQ